VLDRGASLAERGDLPNEAHEVRFSLPLLLLALLVFSIMTERRMPAGVEIRFGGGVSRELLWPVLMGMNAIAAVGSSGVVELDIMD
jgi:hypothetical protein